jgi:mono/diheme cytochrome c family protein
LIHEEPHISVTHVGRRQFTTACSTCHVPTGSASSRRARIDVSIDGVTFIRSKSDAAQRRTRTLVHVAWDVGRFQDDQGKRLARVTRASH